MTACSEITHGSMTKIYTLVNALGEWIVDTKPPTFTNESLANPIASFVLDPTDGHELLPTAEALQAAMRVNHDEGKGGKGNAEPHCLWLAVSRKSMRIAVNFNGDRVGKVELPEDDLASAFFVTRHGEHHMDGVSWTRLIFRSEGSCRHHDHRQRIVLLLAFLGIHHTC